MRRGRSRRLFWKYVVVISILVGGVLLMSSLVDLYFSYQATKAALAGIQREKAAAAAAEIEQFMREIEKQLRWTSQAAFDDPAAEAEEHDLGFLRLLRNVPAITDASHLDRSGRERFRVSRLTLDVRGSQRDFSREPRFLQARFGVTYFGPVYFRNESEPYMTIAVPGGEDGVEVTVAEVNLGAIWDVVSQIKIGKAGSAYVADSSGHLVAHPDISLVLQKRDLSSLPQVQAARSVRAGSPGDAGAAMIGSGLQGGQVLTSHAAIAPLSWLVFVEQPLAEVWEPLQASILRGVVLFVVSLALSVVSCVLLARRMVAPIRLLQAGAARIGGGDLGHRIDVRTGDELEALAEEFNRTTTRLEESYANLERKVQERTRDLTEALDQHTGISQILRAISSSSADLQPVLDAVAEKVAQLCDADNAAIFRREGAALHLVATFGQAKAEPVPGGFPVDRRSVTGRAVVDRVTVHIHDFAAEGAVEYPVGKAYQPSVTSRTMLATPLLREAVPLGAILVRRLQVRPFTDRQIELVKTFADQAVIAIETVRLLQELQARTQELTRSVETLRALGEVGQAVSSTLDLQTVLGSIVAHAVDLSASDAGAIYEYDEGSGQFHLRIAHRTGEELVAALRATPIRSGEGAVGRAVATRAPVQIPDLLAEGAYEGRLNELLVRSGFRAVLAVPLVREDRIVGGLVVRRRIPGAWPFELVALLETFAAQSTLAIQNARLFREIDAKSREIEIASRHKSQFVANMSHELRTPLNAILGYVELILDNIFGEVPEAIRDSLERTRSNGRHLLRLINDVLDLSKIEAGQLSLSLAEYSMHDVIQTACAAVESLASEKQLALKVTASPDLPPGRGDEGRITQVLLNLVGNAIKFTDAGEIAIEARAVHGVFAVSVSDTGPGISEADQQKIFGEFQQADNSSTRAKGGTGLGLAIAKRIIEMHGGRLWVESSPGKGSTFWLTLPVRVERQRGET